MNAMQIGKALYKQQGKRKDRKEKCEEQKAIMGF